MWLWPTGKVPSGVCLLQQLRDFSLTRPTHYLLGILALPYSALQYAQSSFFINQWYSHHTEGNPTTPWLPQGHVFKKGKRLLAVAM